VPLFTISKQKSFSRKFVATFFHLVALERT